MPASRTPSFAVRGNRAAMGALINGKKAHNDSEQLSELANA